MSDNEKTMTNVDEQFNKEFTKPITRIGPITILIAGLLSVLPAIYLAVRYGALPPISNILKAWTGVLSAYGAIYIIEPISYFAVLGIGGT